MQEVTSPRLTVVVDDTGEASVLYALVARLQKDGDTKSANFLLDLLQEREALRLNLAYLAECHAATAEHEGVLRRTSKYTRKRLASICDKAVDMMRGSVFQSGQGEYKMQQAAHRCEEASRRVRRYMQERG